VRLTVRVAAAPDAVRTEHPGVGVVREAALEHLQHLRADASVLHWGDELHPVVEVARHQIGRAHEHALRLAGAFEAVDPRVLKEAAHDRDDLDVVRDPRHAGASNDLGYSWADQGKNLDRAETLVKTAVAAEPDNQSFLDSLGWVLYKRGKFAEALVYFEKAIGPASRPDPVVLDHMGDVLYRLSKNDQAAKQWKRAQDRLDQVDSEREDLKKLRLQLMQKLRQQEKGQPVEVAPIADATAAGPQAKN